jgi:uncharacterized protein (TIGR02145 family)
MADNLDVEIFQNGDTIPEIKSEKEWYIADLNKQPGWCYYNNDPANGKKYGKLYNWYAVDDPRGLAPKGWHIPSYKEKNELEYYNDKRYDRQMHALLNKLEMGGTNYSGFDVKPGGYRWSSGKFVYGNMSVGFWTATLANPGYVRVFVFSKGNNGFGDDSVDTGQGMYIRCIKN